MTATWVLAQELQSHIKNMARDKVIFYQNSLLTQDKREQPTYKPEFEPYKPELQLDKPELPLYKIILSQDEAEIWLNKPEFEKNKPELPPDKAKPESAKNKKAVRICGLLFYKDI